MNEFFVVPEDTLWLRTGSPFLAGEDSFDPGVFPPTPWTFQGMIRTRILLDRFEAPLDQVDGARIARLVGTSDALPRGWWFEGPFPARTEGGTVEPWFPWPAFLWASPPGEIGEPVVRTREIPWAAREDLIGDRANDSLEGVPGSLAQPARGWVSAGNLLWSLTGWGLWDPGGAVMVGKTHGSGDPLPPFVKLEGHPGLRVDPKIGAAQDHMFYVAIHHRFQPGSGLYGALYGAGDIAALDGGGFLGRRGRTVRIEPGTACRAWRYLRDSRHLAVSPEEGEEPVHLRLVLLSPAFVDGPYPFQLPPGATVRSVQAVPGPVVGGFDLRGGGSRDARATWGAGSTWWIELDGDEETREAALQQLAAWPPPGASPEQQFGFGQYLVALFNPETGEPIAPEEPDDV